MSKTILYIGMSLDGYVAGQNDDLSWLDDYQDIDYGYDDFFRTVGSIIQGRRTYDVEVKKGWVGVHPVPVFVLSNDVPKDVPKGYHFVSGDLKKVLKRAQEVAGEKNVWIAGGAGTAQQFINEGLVDEIILGIVPKMLGSGIRLFEDIQSHPKLSVIDAKRFEKSLVILTYKVDA